MAYGRYKDFTKRTESYKILKDYAIKIANNRRYDGFQRWLGAMVYMFFDKNSEGILNLC